MRRNDGFATLTAGGERPPLHIADRSSSRTSIDASAGRGACGDRTRTSLEALAFWLLAGAAVAAPLLFGSVDTVSIAMWCVVLGVATVAAATQSRTGPHDLAIAVIVVLALVYGVLLHEHTSSHPWLARPQPIWAQASDTLGVGLTGFATVARDEPWFALGAALASSLALICGLIVGSDRKRARQLVLVLAWFGAAHAGYAVASFVLEPGMILWWQKQNYLNNLTGTFVNRNTAAIYFGSCAILWLLLLSHQIRLGLPPGPISVKRLRRHVLNARATRLMKPGAAFFVCLFALFLTGSRAGVTLSCTAMALAVMLYWRRDLPRGGLLKGAVIVSAAVLVVMQLLGGLIEARFGQVGLSGEGRVETYWATLTMIGQAPWFGTGPGSFSWGFPRYRSPEVSMWGVWDLAHSTLLETAAELGIPFAALLALAWIGGLIVLARRIMRARQDTMLPIATLCVAILASSHSTIDFTLQIPGYAIGFFALFGVGISQALCASLTPTDQSRHAVINAEPN